MRIRAPLSILSAFMLSAAPVAAQAPAPPAAAPAPLAGPGTHTQLSIEQLMSTEVPVVRGASRFDQQVVDAPASITIVTREEIQRFGYRTLADVLRGVRGFYVTYDRNYTYLGSRGLARPGDYNSRILVLLNGHRMNDNVYDSTLIATEFPIDIELVDRIEVVRGPSSSLYGTSAFFAVVNVLTRGGAGVSSTGADVRLGSLGTRSARVDTGHLFGNGAETLFSASTYYSEGQGGRDAELSAPGMDVDEASRLFGAFSQGPWSAQAAYSTRRKMIPTGAFGTTRDDPRSHTVDARALASVTFDRPVGGAQVTARAHHDWYLYDGSYAYPDAPLYLDGTRGYWWGGEAQVLRRWRAHALTGGVEVRRNSRQDQWGWDDTEPLTMYLDDRRQSTTGALYVQDEWRVRSWALLNAGLRHDRSSQFGEATSPRFAVILKPTNTSAIKLLHGRAFRAPNVFESYYYTATGPLEPERITTNEIVAELYDPRGMRIAVTGFVYRLSELITHGVVYLPEPDTAFSNAASTRAAGAELEVERTWRNGWRVTGTFTVQDALESGNEEALSNSPKHTAGVRAAGPVVADRISAGVETLHTGSRLTTWGTTVPAFTVMNLTVRSVRPLVGGLSWSAHVENLFDARYFDPGTADHPVDRLRQDGRTLSVTLSWRF